MNTEYEKLITERDSYSNELTNKEEMMKDLEDQIDGSNAEILTLKQTNEEYKKVLFSRNNEIEIIKADREVRSILLMDD
jgi:predicted transcriptional regulator